MSHLVSITSQGQISIPAAIRRELGLDKYKKVFVEKKGNSVVVEPADDFLKLEGFFKNKAIKEKSMDEIMAMEKKAVEEAMVERYRKKLRRSQ